MKLKYRLPGLYKRTICVKVENYYLSPIPNLIETFITIHENLGPDVCS